MFVYVCAVWLVCLWNCSMVCSGLKTWIVIRVYDATYRCSFSVLYTRPPSKYIWWRFGTAGASRGQLRLVEVNSPEVCSRMVDLSDSDCSCVGQNMRLMEVGRIKLLPGMRTIRYPGSGCERVLAPTPQSHIVVAHYSDECFYFSTGPQCFVAIFHMSLAGKYIFVFLFLFFFYLEREWHRFFLLDFIMLVVPLKFLDWLCDFWQ